MEIKAVLCDLDNTLIDFRNYKDKSINSAVAAMRKRGLDVSQEDGVKGVWDIYWEKGWEHKEVFQTFLSRVEGEVDYSLLATAIHAYRDERNKNMRTYKRVKPTLRNLRDWGYKLGIVSDAPKLKAWLRLEYLGIIDYFDVVVAFEDTFKFKPDSAPFMKALDSLGIEPVNALFIGDNVERDVVGANNLGMLSVFAVYGNVFEVDKSGADFDIHSFSELELILDKS